MKKKTRYIAIFIAIIAMLYALGRYIPESWPEKILDSAQNFGPIAIIGVIVLEVVIAPIPGGIIPVIAGALYNPLEGFLYVWIGNMIGSTLAFLISEKYGKKVANKIVKHKTLKKYEKLVQKNTFIIFLLYAIPLFPIDIISFALGLTTMRLRKFLIIISFGYISYIFVLIQIGDSLTEGSAYKKITILGLTILIFGFGYIIQRKIEAKED